MCDNLEKFVKLKGEPNEMIKLMNEQQLFAKSELGS